MPIDLFKNMAHNLKKKTQGSNIMFDTIDPIVRFVSKDLIKQYLDSKRVDYRTVEWEQRPPLLKLDIIRVLDRISKDKYKEIFSDFCRVTRMHTAEGIKTLQNSVMDIPTEYENGYEKIFWCFLNYRKLFEDAEYALNYVDPYKEFLKNILTNQKLLGVLIICISFLINLAQVFNDEKEARYVAINIIHFILGALTVFFMNRDKK